MYSALRRERLICVELSPEVVMPTPTKSNRDGKRLVRGLAVAAVALLAAACGRGGPPQGAPGGFPPAPVSVLEVKPVTVPVSFEYVGQTAGSKEAEVRARVEGILEKRSYQEGGPVKAGQVLFSIDPKPYAAQVGQAEASLAQAEAQQTQARRNLVRQQELMASGMTTRRDLDDAQSAVETAVATVKLAQARLTEAKLNLSYTTVTAPVSGVASRALKSEGSLVSPGQESLLTTVSQLDPLYVNFSVSESDRLRIDREIAQGRLTLPDPAKGGQTVSLKLADGSIFPRQGRLAFIDARINPATGAFDARAEIANADGALRPGQFVRVIVEGSQRPNAIVLPQRAVMEGPQGKFVYVAGKSAEGKDVASPRPVVVGDWVDHKDERLWVVESGVKAGEQVVVEGMGKLFPVPGGAPIVLGPPPGAAPEVDKGAPAKGEPGSRK
jgi:membrane fusion protein, multidrug efflux system